MRFPFDQTFWFQIPVIPCDKWAGIFRLAETSRPKPSRSKFGAKMRNKQTLTFLLALVLCDDSEAKKKNDVLGEDNHIALFRAVTFCMHVKESKNSYIVTDLASCHTTLKTSICFSPIPNGHF